MVSANSLPLKRGWRGLALGVLALIFVSMVGPLIFLLGLHTKFHYGRWAGFQESHPGVGIRSYNSVEAAKDFYLSEADQSKHVEKLLTAFDPKLQQIETITGAMERREFINGMNGKETKKPCQLELGSYCTWRNEHREEMKDSMVKKLKDLLFLARAYYPTIAKLPSRGKLSHEMKQNIQDFEHIFSQASVDADLPFRVENKLHKMEKVIIKAKSMHVDCKNVDKKLRQILDLTEDEAYFHMKQSAFLYQLAVQTKPKSHHCLSMRLTLEYFRQNIFDNKILRDDKSGDPSFFHYVIFSNNVLASSVVINSTMMHAKEREKLVFHVITDGQNFAAMKAWFLRSFYWNATINVFNIDNFASHYLDSSDSLQLDFSDEFRVSIRNSNEPSSIQMKIEYISVFGPAYFLLPEIFPNLDRVVVLDDDVLVQKDLSPLWRLQMEGKVNGALEFCALRLGQLKSYLGGNIYDSNSCAWMSGLNVIDLKKWKELNLTETYGRLLRSLRSKNGASSSVATFPATLLTFENHIYALDSSWSLSGLGHHYRIGAQAIKDAAVLHYNGKMKPWFDLGISNYKRLWKSFLKRDDPYLEECNVSI